MAGLELLEDYLVLVFQEQGRHILNERYFSLIICERGEGNTSVLILTVFLRQAETEHVIIPHILLLLTLIK